MNVLDLIAIDLTFITGALVFWFGAGAGQRMTRIGLKVGKDELERLEGIARHNRVRQKAYGQLADINELSTQSTTGAR